MAVRKFFVACAMTLLAATVEAQMPQPRYIEAPEFPNQIYLSAHPNADSIAAEQWFEYDGGAQFVRNVKEATLIPYMPDEGKANGAAIIIAPGGAFMVEAFQNGGYDAAEYFRSQGFATFILKYRLEDTPRDEADYQAFFGKRMMGYFAGGSSGVYAPATPDYAYEDACNAVAYVRSHAKEYNVSPEKIGLIGFSAGALMAVYNAESAPLAQRANFIGSIYGQLVMRDMDDHLPPMFAAMSSDDVLSGQSGFEIIQAWQKHGIVELHLYGQGGHGFGVRNKPYTSDLWTLEFMAFLRMLKIIE